MSAWNQLFDEVDRVFRETSQLLKDADALLAERGYVCCHSSLNQVGMQISGSIAKPGQWYPRWVVRFYAREEDASVCQGPLGFFAVFFSDEAKQGDWACNPRIEEPLVVVGGIEGNPGKPIEWDYWMCKWWFWTEDGDVGGRVSEIKPEENKQSSWSRIQTFAIALSAIESIQDLREKATDPLLELLEEESEGNTPRDKSNAMQPMLFGEQVRGGDRHFPPRQGANPSS